MLETEEVDVDYFTPAPSTSLADIFGSTNYTGNQTENSTLTYTPPKPQNISSKTEESKATQCVFACALLGYEWSKNIYSAKGKLGFAILKSLQTNDYNIVLYDSSKTTLSFTNISPLLEIIVKGNVYISFYDKYGKYWSLYGTQEEITKVIDHLQNLNVVIKHSQHTDAAPPEPNIRENPIINTISSQCDREKESDTDSSGNIRTKASILSRMANMGHSVLPPQIKSTEKTSDSSDTNETDKHPKTVRHKAIKNPVKRNNTDKNLIEVKNTIENAQSIIMSKTNQTVDNFLYSFINGQLVPIKNTNIINNTSCTSDMNLFMSEQRISSSELRININRINDKIDQMLEKIKDVNHKDNTNSTANFQVDILQKLLSEYETKIKTYEEIIKTNNLSSNKNENELYKMKLSELETINKNKDIEISNLNNEIKFLQCSNKPNAEDLFEQVNELKRQLEIKDKELHNVKSEKKLLSTFDNSSSDLENKIKNIMNDVYQAISVNFGNDTNYSGDTVKSITATVIKRITTKSLNDL